MVNRLQRRMPQFIEAIHEEVSTFARTRLQAEGRGVVRATIPVASALEPRGRSRADLAYYTASEIRSRTADLTGESRDAADMLLRMIDTYDPTMQAVVIASVEGQNPLSLKVKLAPPVR